MTLSSKGRCDQCDSIVQNIPGKRHSKEKLTEIHNESCPGLTRKKAS
jgi:hypothetical protein